MIKVYFLMYFLGYITYPPSHPWPALNGYCKYACHCWDYCASVGAWNLLNMSDNYIPSERDIAFGKLEFDMFSDFISNGKSLESYGWKPVNSGSSFPFEIAIGKIGNNLDKVDTYYENVKDSKCNFLKNIYFGFLYWLMN